MRLNIPRMALEKDSPFNNNTENIVYMILGSILTVLNLIIFTAIIRHHALRNHKEYLLLGLLVFFNAVLGIGFFSAGVYRYNLLNEDISKWDCMKTFHAYLLAGCPCVCSWLLPMVALDRLLAVTRPIHYYVFENDHCLLIIGFSFLIYIICCSGAFLGMMSTASELIPSVCDTRDMYGSNYKLFETGCILFGHILAVALYTVVIVTFTANSQVPHNPLEPRSASVLLQRRSRIVQTFGIFAVITVCLVVLPFTAIFLAYSLIDPQDRDNKLNPLYLLVSKLALLNPSINVFIYAIRHNEIHAGVKTLLIGQAMPSSIDDWHISPSSLQRARASPAPPTHAPHLQYSLAHHTLMRSLQHSSRL